MTPPERIGVPSPSLEFPLTASAESRLRSQIGAHESWARTQNRPARTQAARDAAWNRFETLVDPAGELPPAVRAKMAENARQAHFKRMALRSVEARRRRKVQQAGPSEIKSSFAEP